MRRHLHWLILALIFIFPTVTQAQVEPAEAGDGGRETAVFNQRAEDKLRQLGLATIGCQYDIGPAGRKCWVTKEHDEITILKELYVYGFRPDPTIGLAFMPVKADKPDAYAFMAVAAPNYLGAPVYIWLPDQDIVKVVRLADLKELPAALAGTLSIYDNELKCPTGYNLSAPRPGLTYDLKTGLVTAVAP